MSKKLYFLISLVLVLALAVPTSAEETLLASYEQSEAAAGNLTAKVDDASANPTAVVTWPMLQGKDACSYDPNFGPGVIVPRATNGNSVLGLFWTNEDDGRVDIRHEWSTSTFDLVKNDKILIDVYIVGPNGVPTTIELWDHDLAWLLGHHDPIVTGKWFTVTFDLSELQETGKRKTDHSQITTIYFSGVTTKDGKVFFDNLRLQRAAAPKPSSPKPKPVKEANDVNVGAKH
jgi:hypothetical protein